MFALVERDCRLVIRMFLRENPNFKINKFNVLTIKLSIINKLSLTQVNKAFSIYLSIVN